MATKMQVIGWDDQRETIGDTGRTWHIQGCACGRDILNHTTESAATEFDYPSFAHGASWCSSLIHGSTIRLRFEKCVRWLTRRCGHTPLRKRTRPRCLPNAGPHQRKVSFKPPGKKPRCPPTTLPASSCGHQLPASRFSKQRHARCTQPF